MSALRLINRLSNVRETGPGRWVTSCPTAAHPHGDRSRGLSIREVDDRVLIHCFAGCGVTEIVEAMGLTLADLYDRPITHGGTWPAAPSIPARDLLIILDREITVAVLILDKVVTQRQVNECEVQRLTLAAARIGKARDMAIPAKVSANA